ncbi:amino acid ABC transporter substrate-binding protein [Singulisphaera sp. PoT]|uniref:amino acid ABC transporter substrate-binding protein n=1 Tax=Singulisphaera sp. PoT TaxID=3411797 RepID=UPI003BF55E56
MAFLKDLVTGVDGESFDVGRVLWVASVLAFMGLSAYSLYRGGAFDALGWGTGYGAMLGGGGAGIGLKRKAEPAE